jgi:hypothetical protein
MMKKITRIVTHISIPIGLVLGLLQLTEIFYPKQYPRIVKGLRGFVSDNWLMLIVIGLLIFIANVLVNKEQGTFPTDEQEPPQEM